ncbi:hypothetical protein [Paractinoplanes hotanensis]|uniref:Uncharacterized protein n=1 Tax=Paractinoplanes hotanensis TaxID=2906497 RepID=A0ABT0Y7A7_9ACTN|nr:hypothetical protein [Actinoplanes hotanensis]MCM4081922.1 hypothetical protein [Actinoplanes hotanensis]
MREIRAKLEGPDAEPGRVAAADVARIILGLERAIARAAYLVLGRPRRGTTGRHNQAIESASRLRFIGVEAGSFVELLGLPDSAEPSDEELPIPVADLSFMAFSRLLDVITSDDPETDTQLAAAVARMASELGIGDRNTAITLIDSTSFVAGEPRRARIDAAVRTRMQQISERPPAARDETLVGVLFEADFEGNTAKLRLASGGVVTVSFAADLADEIQEALRSQTGVEGLVHYDMRTAQARNVELRAIVRSVQLEFDADSFWQPLSFDALRAEQNTSGFVQPDELAIDDLTDAERDAFLVALAE